VVDAGLAPRRALLARRLQGVGNLRLPIDAGRRADTGPEDRHARRLLSLSVELTVALESLAERFEVTLNTLVQGAWAILQSRYSGKRDVIFGATRGCRRSSVAGAEAIVGPLLNTVPVRVTVSPDAMLMPWLQELRSQWVALRDYENTPLARIHEWSEMPAGTPLFESVVVFERQALNSVLQGFGGEWKHRSAELLQRSDTALTLFGHGKPRLELGVAFDRQRFAPASIDRMLGHLRPARGVSSGRRKPVAACRCSPTRATADSRSLERHGARLSSDVCSQHFFEQHARDWPARPALIRRPDAELRRRTPRQSLRRHLEKQGSTEQWWACLPRARRGGDRVGHPEGRWRLTVAGPRLPPQRLQHVVDDAQVARGHDAGVLRRLDGTDVKRSASTPRRVSLAQPRHDLPARHRRRISPTPYTPPAPPAGPRAGWSRTARSSITRSRLGAVRIHRGGPQNAIRLGQFDVFVSEVFTPLSSGGGARARIRVGRRRSPISSVRIALGVTVTAMPSSYWHEWVASMADGDLTIRVRCGSSSAEWSRSRVRLRGLATQGGAGSAGSTPTVQRKRPARRLPTAPA
jgi:non-ribosomal peptide synthetase component F